MKHYLNFKPTIVFRKGSSFMLKTLLFLFYLIPIGIAVYWGFLYACTNNLNDAYTSAQKMVDDKIKEKKPEIMAQKPDGAKLENSRIRYSDYKRIAYICSSSWKALLDRFESMIPADMRFITVTVRPTDLLRVSVTGEVKELSALTDFLQALYDCDVFSSPRIKQHVRSDRPNEDGVIRFSLDVDYAGESGDLP